MTTRPWSYMDDAEALDGPPMSPEDIRRDNVAAIRAWMEAHPGECGDCRMNPGWCERHDINDGQHEDDPRIAHESPEEGGY